MIPSLLPRLLPPPQFGAEHWMPPGVGLGTWALAPATDGRLHILAPPSDPVEPLVRAAVGEITERVLAGRPALGEDPAQARISPLAMGFARRLAWAARRSEGAAAVVALRAARVAAASLSGPGPVDPIRARSAEAGGPLLEKVVAGLQAQLGAGLARASARPFQEGLAAGESRLVPPFVQEVVASRLTLCLPAQELALESAFPWIAPVLRTPLSLPVVRALWGAVRVALEGLSARVARDKLTAEDRAFMVRFCPPAVIDLGAAEGSRRLAQDPAAVSFLLAGLDRWTNAAGMAPFGEAGKQLLAPGAGLAVAASWTEMVEALRRWEVLAGLAAALTSEVAQGGLRAALVAERPAPAAVVAVALGRVREPPSEEQAEDWGAQVAAAWEGALRTAPDAVAQDAGAMSVLAFDDVEEALRFAIRLPARFAELGLRPATSLAFGPVTGWSDGTGARLYGPAVDAALRWLPWAPLDGQRGLRRLGVVQGALCGDGTAVADSFREALAETTLEVRARLGEERAGTRIGLAVSCDEVVVVLAGLGAVTGAWELLRLSEADWAALPAGGPERRRPAPTAPRRTAEEERPGRPVAVPVPAAGSPAPAAGTGGAGAFAAREPAVSREVPPADPQRTDPQPWGGLSAPPPAQDAAGGDLGRTGVGAGAADAGAGFDFAGPPPQDASGSPGSPFEEAWAPPEEHAPSTPEPTDPGASPFDGGWSPPAGTPVSAAPQMTERSPFDDPPGAPLAPVSAAPQLTERSPFDDEPSAPRAPAPTRSTSAAPGSPFEGPADAAPGGGGPAAPVATSGDPFAAAPASPAPSAPASPAPSAAWSPGPPAYARYDEAAELDRVPTEEELPPLDFGMPAPGPAAGPVPAAAARAAREAAMPKDPPSLASPAASPGSAASRAKPSAAAVAPPAATGATLPPAGDDDFADLLGDLYGGEPPVEAPEAEPFGAADAQDHAAPPGGSPPADLSDPFATAPATRTTASASADPFADRGSPDTGPAADPAADPGDTDRFVDLSAFGPDDGITRGASAGDDADWLSALDDEPPPSSPQAGRPIAAPLATPPPTVSAAPPLATPTPQVAASPPMTATAPPMTLAAPPMAAADPTVARATWGMPTPRMGVSQLAPLFRGYVALRHGGSWSFGQPFGRRMMDRHSYPDTGQPDDAYRHFLRDKIAEGFVLQADLLGDLPPGVTVEPVDVDRLARVLAEL